MEWVTVTDGTWPKALNPPPTEHSCKYTSAHVHILYTSLNIVVSVLKPAGYYNTMADVSSQTFTTLCIVLSDNIKRQKLSALNCFTWHDVVVSVFEMKQSRTHWTAEIPPQVLFIYSILPLLSPTSSPVLWIIPHFLFLSPTCSPVCHCLITQPHLPHLPHPFPFP